MSEQNQSDKPGWWGATLSKLKSALSKTKEAVVDCIVDRSVDTSVGTTYGTGAGEQTGRQEQEIAAATSTGLSVAELETVGVSTAAAAEPQTIPAPGDLTANVTTGGPAVGQLNQPGT